MKKILCVLLAIVLAFGLVGCGNADTPKPDASAGTSVSADPDVSDGDEEIDESKLPVLRVAVMPYVTSLGVKYIVDNKLDVENGFKIETVMFSIGAPMNEALGANLWDVGTIGAAAVVGVSTYNAVIIADLLEANGGISLFVRPDSPVAQIKGYNPSYPDIYGDPETVRGADMLLSVGSINQLNQLKWLEKIGVKDSDVNTVNMDVAQSYQAFLAGEGDIVALNPPFSFMAKENGWVNVGGLKELGVPFVDMLMANPKSLADAKTEEVITKFMDVLFDAQGALQSDPAMAEKLLAEYFKENASEATEDQVKQDIQRVQFLTKDDLKTREMGQFIKIMAEFMADTGKLETDKLPLFETNVTDKYIKAIAD